MIRLYFDWNVLVRLKARLLPELDALLSANKHRFHIFFSTAHIGDIYKSYAPDQGMTTEIKSDLSFIQAITSESCFVPTSTGVIPDLRDPHELFEDRIISETVTDEILNQFKMTSTQPDSLLQSLLASFSQIPLDVINNKEQLTQLEPFFPGIESNNTFQGLFTSTISLFQDLYTTEKYKDLRILFQQGIGINRDQMYNSPSPLKQLDKYISDSPLEENTFEEFQKKLTTTTEESPKSWFDTISNKYITLDMTGYKEDKIKVTERKKDTFKNTIEDSFHTAFASQCDIYITNDERNYYKAKAVYETLEINTKVFDAGEFVSFIQEYITQEQSNNFLENIFSKIKTLDAYGSPESPDMTIYFLKDFILDYFNKVYWIVDKEKKEHEDNWMMMLTKEKPTNGRATFLKDIDMLIAKLIQLFGIPDQNKLLISSNEATEIQKSLNWEGRKWFVGNLLIKFIALNGYFQLYIYPVSREAEKSVAI